MAITLRSVKGSGLTNAEIDANFTTLDVRDLSGGVAGLTGLAVNIWNAAKTFKSLLSFAGTANRAQVLQDKDGSVALLSDITDERTAAATLTNKNLISPVITGGLDVSGALSASGNISSQGGVWANSTGILGWGAAGSTSEYISASNASHSMSFAINGTESMFLSMGGNISIIGSYTIGSFTLATRPAHAAGKMIYVSDGGAGAVFQGSNGGAWVNLG